MLSQHRATVFIYFTLPLGFSQAVFICVPPPGSTSLPVRQPPQSIIHQQRQCHDSVGDFLSCLLGAYGWNVAVEASDIPHPITYLLTYPFGVKINMLHAETLESCFVECYWPPLLLWLFDTVIHFNTLNSGKCAWVPQMEKLTSCETCNQLSSGELEMADNTVMSPW